MNRDTIYKSDVKSDNDPRMIFKGWISNDCCSILDVGCACGDFAKAVKDEYLKSEIIGLEYNEGSIAIAKKLNVFKDIYQEDLDNIDIEKYKNFQNYFDYISFGDVLEHLRDPQKVINIFKNYLKPHGRILISLPNIAHASIKANLLLNNFDYTDVGILDKTHIKFFTYKSISQMLAESDIEICEIKYTDWCGWCGTQKNNPYEFLPKKIKNL